ncbi:MAG TPA: hypothetical protein VLG47_04290, partial [Candidatus Saccharimonadales bacterium]|nr:hypothetical protein [Candidatus Saccharimonadales bacterium]
VMAQILEDRGFHGNTTGNIELLDAIFAEIFSRTGQSDPANTNLVGDYFDGDGIGQIALDALRAAPGTTFWTNWKNKFSSETEARKNRDGTTSSFFTRGTNTPFNNRNWLVGGYLDGWHRVPEYMHPYLLIAELEQKSIAARRKKIGFCWDMLEGAEWKIYGQGSFQNIHFDTPAGDIFKSTLNGVPPEMMFRQSVIMQLIGDGMIHWGAAARTSRDIGRWIRSYNGGFNTSKTKWRKQGTTQVVDYNPNDPTMPAKSPGDNPNNYPGNQVQIIPPNFYGPTPYGIHDALAGRWMAAQVIGKSSLMRYAPGATYKINGGSAINMYPGGTNPRTGSLGDATVSLLNNRNAGQNNIVYQCEAKKPIHIVGGNPGNGFILWCNPHARPNEVNEVTFTESGTHTFTAVGPAMRLYNW